MASDTDRAPAEASAGPGIEAEKLASLLHAWSIIGPNARSILCAIADRLVIGREHGDFTAPHDWDAETLAEELDASVYRAAKLLKLGGQSELPERPRRCLDMLCRKGISHVGPCDYSR